jgi:hypothetical protein
MRILLFVSVLGILISIAVLILVIIRSNRETTKDSGKRAPGDKP